MSRHEFIAAMAAASIALSANAANAGTVFDFVPRMDFYDQPDLVQKDNSDPTRVCVALAPAESDCFVTVKDAKKIMPEKSDE